MFELIEAIDIDVDAGALAGAASGAGAGRARGRAWVDANHPLLRDHFPDAPVLPGTWALELAAQVAGPFVEELDRHRDQSNPGPDRGRPRWAVLAMVRSAKLKQPLWLPAALEIEARTMRVDAATVTVRVDIGRAPLSSEVAVTAELTFGLVEAPAGSSAVAQREARLARWKAAF